MTYQQRFGRGLMLGMFAIFCAVGVVLLVSAVAGGRDAPSPVFAAFWLGALAWNAYWFLLRIAVSLTLGSGALSWRAPLRDGQIPVAEITEVRPMRLTSSAVVIEHTSGRPLLVVASKGLRPIFDELSSTRPDLEMRLGWQTRLAERLPGRPGWEKDD